MVGVKTAPALLVLFIAGCGSAAASSPGADAGNEAGGTDDAGPSDGGGSSDGGATTGTLHIAWTLQLGNGSATDCITANTRNIEVDVKTAAAVPVVSNTYYCVDMGETFTGLAPGTYLVELRLLDDTNSVTATAGAAVSVAAGAVVSATPLTLVLPGP